jgi:hypothetical protein
VAIAFVQKCGTEATSTTSSATIALVTSNTVAAGHYIVGFVSQRLGGQFTVTGVSGGGLTWTVDAVEPGVAGQTTSTSVFSAQAPAGLASSSTITATLSGSTSSRKVMGLYDFSGVATSSPVGVTTVNNGSTGNPAVTLSSAATAGDLVFVGYYHNVTGTTGTQTPAAGFTNAGSAVAGASTWVEGYAQYKVDAAGTADVAGYTPNIDTTTTWAAAAVCYHQVAVPTQRARSVIAMPKPNFALVNQPLVAWA